MDRRDKAKDLKMEELRKVMAKFQSLVAKIPRKLNNPKPSPSDVSTVQGQELLKEPTHGTLSEKEREKPAHSNTSAHSSVENVSIEKGNHSSSTEDVASGILAPRICNPRIRVSAAAVRDYFSTGAPIAPNDSLSPDRIAESGTHQSPIPPDQNPTVATQDTSELELLLSTPSSHESLPIEDGNYSSSSVDEAFVELGDPDATSGILAPILPNESLSPDRDVERDTHQSLNVSIPGILAPILPNESLSPDRDVESNTHQPSHVSGTEQRTHVVKARTRTQPSRREAKRSSESDSSNGSSESDSSNGSSESDSSNGSSESDSSNGSSESDSSNGSKCKKSRSDAKGKTTDPVPTTGTTVSAINDSWHDKTGRRKPCPGIASHYEN